MIIVFWESAILSCWHIQIGFLQSAIMSSNSSPVRLQVPVPVPDRVYGELPSMYRREMGLRRIFVQTDIGNVLGIEVDRDDRVQTIKKKLQVALCLPTEQSALTFGDVVLEHDFNEVRNDSPLLLTRGLYRTSSTPCLSPSGQRSKDRSKPLEIVGGSHGCPKVRQLVRQCMKALDNGIEPTPAGGGLGGAYCIQNVIGKKIAILKPTDEEPFAPNNPNGFVGRTLGQPGLKRSIRVGETGFREVAAYLLDHGHFARVPPTALVKATHSIFNVNRNVLPCKSEPFSKIGSLQRFEPHEYDASEHGTSRFPVGAVHRIGILDIRILNTDRHGGNILVRKLKEDKHTSNRTQFDMRVYDALELIPIDHGLCLPEALDDPYFEWLHWPQASLPFSEEELEYIRQLSAASDVELLRKELPMLRECCLRVLTITTIFLQKAAEAGLTLAEIGGMMSREIGAMDDEASELENICMLAKLYADFELSAIRSCHSPVVSTMSINQSAEDEQPSVQFHMDQEECLNLKLALPSGQKQVSPSLPRSSITPRVGISDASSMCFNRESPAHSFNDHYPISESIGSLDILYEAVDLEEDVPNSTNKETRAFDPKTVRTNGCKRNTSCSGSGTRWNNSVVEARSVAGMRGVSSPELTRKARDSSGNPDGFELSQMSEEEWNVFLECFQQLLPNAYVDCKAKNFGQLPRLGTSCQF